MVKRFYYSLVSLKYVYFMFGIPLVIFALAFISTTRKSEVLRILMIVCAALLAVVLFFYYRDKLRIKKTLKSIDNYESFSRGGMMDRTYVLEDRMLVCEGLKLSERKTVDIQSLSFDHEKYGKCYLNVEDTDGKYSISTLSKQEANRFAAFLKRKNPNIQINGLSPEGNGSLKGLGAIES